jgi:hypothetical protein
LQKFEQRFGKKRLERPKARLSKRYPDLGMYDVVTTTLAVHSAAKTHMRRVIMLEGYPELEMCGVVATTIVAVRTGTGTPTLPEIS